VIGLWIVLGAVLISSGGCATHRVHPDFKERHERISAIAILPPDLDVFRVTFRGDRDPMPEITSTASKTIEEAIQDRLKEKGYIVHSIDLNEATLAEKPDVRAALHTVHTLYQKVLEEIAKGRWDRFTHSLGPEVNVLADHSQSDALILIKGIGVKKTGGEIARELFFTALFGTPFLPSETLLLIGLVDGDTGDLLWFHYNQNVGVDPADSERLRSLVQAILAPFPDSAAKQKESKRRSKRPEKTISPATRQPTHIPSSPSQPGSGM